jgi:hypothetical protein
MTATYRLQTIPGASLIIRSSDQAIIPADPANADYQAYLRWTEQGNSPEVSATAEPSAPARNWSQLAEKLYRSSLYQEHLRVVTRSAPSQLADSLWWLDKDLTTVLVNWVTSESGSAEEQQIAETRRVAQLRLQLSTLESLLAECGFPLTESHTTEILNALTGTGFSDVAEAFG